VELGRAQSDKTVVSRFASMLGEALRGKVDVKVREGGRESGKEGGREGGRVGWAIGGGRWMREGTGQRAWGDGAHGW
jgi:hypothetical protein